MAESVEKITYIKLAKFNKLSKTINIKNIRLEDELINYVYNPVFTRFCFNENVQVRETTYEMNNLSQNILSKVQIQNKHIDKTSSYFHSTSLNVFLVPFFNFLYYFGYSPFKIQFDTGANKYYIKTHGVQQVLCAISQGATCLFTSLSTIVTVIQILDLNDFTFQSITIFDVGSNVALVGTSVFLIYSSWKRKELILEIVERTRFNSASNRNLRIIGAMVQFCSLSLLCILSIVSWIIIKDYLILEQGILGNFFNSSEVSDNYEKSYSISGNIGNSEPNNNNDTSDGFLEISKTIGTNLVMIVLVYMTLYYTIFQIFFMLLALALKQTGNEFERNLKLKGYHDEGDGNSGLCQGIALYKELKHTTELIKNVYGNAMIGYYLSSVIYLAEAPHILLGNRRDHEKLVMIFSSFSTLIWVTAAEFHHQVQSSVLKWTEYHCSRNDLCTNDRLKLFSISNEISSTDVRCIAMANKCFSVTYKHLSSMFGVIATYGIIVFQLYGHEQFRMGVT